MNNNFEKEVYYFIELVFNNIQSAKTKKNKKKAILTNLKVKSNGEKIIVFNKEQKYSYALYTKQIQDFKFKQYLTKHIALIYIDNLTNYLNNKITFEELEDIKARLRHKDIRTTSNEYGHMYKERKISLANDLTNFRSQINENNKIVTPSETSIEKLA